MLISVGHLRRLLNEAVRVRADVTNRRGQTVPYGSKSHVRELEKDWEMLVRLKEEERTRNGSQSKTYYVYARAAEEAKRELNRARKHGVKQGHLGYPHAQ